MFDLSYFVLNMSLHFFAYIFSSCLFLAPIFILFLFFYLELCNPYYPQCVLKNRNNNTNSLFFSCFLKFSGKRNLYLHHSVLKLEPNLSKTNNQIYLPYFSSATYILPCCNYLVVIFGQNLALNKTNIGWFFIFAKNYTLLFPQIIT